MRSLRLALLLTLSFVAACSSGRSKPGNGKCPTGCTTCDPSTGICKDCVPGAAVCQGTAVQQCNADGTIGPTVKVCDTANNEVCTGGTCLSACDVAAQTHSYIGCDYWPTTTMNPELNPAFDFAVAVANPLTVGDVVQGASANITVTRGGKSIATATVAPGEVGVIKLPWVPEISQNSLMPATVKLLDGAYHLVSSLPVTVYQFNALEYEIPATMSCQDLFGSDPNTCHSYTNDASILLPTTALRGDYLVIARQSFSLDTGGGPSVLPGFVAIVATADNTKVTIVSSAHTLAGGGVPALAPGSTGSYTLDAGEVLQIASDTKIGTCANTSSDGNGSYCDLGPPYDLTGSRVTADKPIVVFGGHACSFVPYDKWACDHLETQVTPLDTWGKTVAVVETEPQVMGEPNVWRVVSGSDNNQITFEPPSVHAPVALQTGKYVEFTAQGGFIATGTGRTAVAQYMVGENATQTTGVDVGDPSLGLGVPVEQYRDNYDFLTPTTYTKSYVNVIAPTGAVVKVDGQPMPSTWKPIGASSYSYQRLEIPPGAHHATSAQRFGITVSGVASFTSYLFVGGQNLNDIPLQ